MSRYLCDPNHIGAIDTAIARIEWLINEFEEFRGNTGGSPSGFNPGPAVREMTNHLKEALERMKAVRLKYERTFAAACLAPTEGALQDNNLRRPQNSDSE